MFLPVFRGPTGFLKCSISFNLETFLKEPYFLLDKHKASSQSKDSMKNENSQNNIKNNQFQVAQDKLKSKATDKTPPGTSPFTARRWDTNIISYDGMKAIIFGRLLWKTL